MSIRWITMVIVLGVVAGPIGCRGQKSDKPPIHLILNMDDQERYDPQETSPIFADNRAMRPLVPGTVAQGNLRQDSAYFNGKTPQGEFIKENPRPVTMELLRRGQERYNIYCATCHDRTGSGRGLVITYPAQGFPPAPSYHDPLLRNYPDGQFFDIITHGIRTMPGYASQIPPDDRWAIVAYIRALQRSQDASRDDVPREQLDMLETK